MAIVQGACDYTKPSTPPQTPAHSTPRVLRPPARLPSAPLPPAQRTVPLLARDCADDGRLFGRLFCDPPSHLQVLTARRTTSGHGGCARPGAAGARMPGEGGAPARGAARRPERPCGGRAPASRAAQWISGGGRVSELTLTMVALVSAEQQQDSDHHQQQQQQGGGQGPPPMNLGHFPPTGQEVGRLLLCSFVSSFVSRNTQQKAYKQRQSAQLAASRP